MTSPHSHAYLLATIEKKYEEILRILCPKDVCGHNKMRIGPRRDGGYVMLDPGHDGIAYSLGISIDSPWDLEMADRGYKIYQYDGTIPNGPYVHPNIFFNKSNISGVDHLLEGEKNIPQIFHENGHDDVDNIILQIDIEGAEWQVFDHIEQKNMEQFSQIIVEFHWILDIDKIDYYITVLKKICRTHQPFHIHYNNFADIILYNDFIACSVLEVSFVRKKGYSFSECTETFPTIYDAPNNIEMGDIMIGNFSYIHDGEFTNFVPDKTMLKNYAADLIFYLQNNRKKLKERISSDRITLNKQKLKIQSLQNQQSLWQNNLNTQKRQLESQVQKIVALTQQIENNESTIYRLRHPLKRLWYHMGGRK